MPSAENDACPLSCLNRLASQCVIHRPSVEKDAPAVRCDYPGCSRRARFINDGGFWCDFPHPRVIPPGKGDA